MESQLPPQKRRPKRLQPADPADLEDLAANQHASRGTQAAQAPGSRVDVADTVSYIMKRLTPEEREILQMVADEMTPKQIADALNVTTIESGVRLRRARAHGQKILLKSK